MESVCASSRLIILCSLLVLMNEPYAECGHSEVVPGKRNANLKLSLKCKWAEKLYQPDHTLHLLCPRIKFYDRTAMRRLAIKHRPSLKYKVQGLNDTFDTNDCLSSVDSNQYICRPHISKFDLDLTVYITIPKKYKNVTLLFLKRRKSDHGHPCLSDNECPGNTACLNNVCRCPGATVLTTQQGLFSFCQPPKDIGEDCMHFYQCANKQSICDEGTGKCTCIAGYTSVNKNGVKECKETRQYGEFCKAPSDCLHAKLENLTCASNVCVCKSGFKFDLQRGCIVVKVVKSHIIMVIACAPVIAAIAFVSVFSIIRKKYYPQKKCRLSVIDYLSKIERNKNADAVKLDLNYKI